MDKEHATPQPKRRFGLSMPKRGAMSTPGLRIEDKTRCNEGTPLNKPSKAIRCNYDHEDAEDTPRALPVTLKASTTSSSHRLGLSRPRKELRKKRLEFLEQNSELVENEAPKKKRKTEPLALPKALADADAATLTLYQSRQRKILELENDIKVWRRGFNATISDLQALKEPRPTKQDVLGQLGIPLEMLQHLDEDC
ncbi:uncharacterized protein LOC115621233 [Scaptodrosophila lebanonensis]|uniref:Uncharacterized protein LOC115621233 n=1 Tax=Drosophila lebanonensis TaxID=7225 RepID=A0A6J2T6C5_DROLE|nr:uncharacterized protein LOC115621233 [Scaptodrosophila lebanonensis]